MSKNKVGRVNILHGQGEIPASKRRGNHTTMGQASNAAKSSDLLPELWYNHSQSSDKNVSPQITD